MSGCARQLDYVQARMPAIDSVDKAAIIDVHVVGRNHPITMLNAADLHTGVDSVLVRLGDEVADLYRIERIANIHGSNTCVEIRQHSHRLVETRMEGVVY